MSDVGELYERLAAAASLESEDAAIRVNATYEPIGGWGDKVSPPTYPRRPDQNGMDPPYLMERRYLDGELTEVALLDSRQSQANRCEEALQDEIDAGRLELPHLALRAESHGVPIRITSLQAPHRSRDAYFRDAQIDQTPFDATPVGDALRGVRPEDATSLYRHSPPDLVYGVWDSHRGLRLATRFARVYTSEMVAWGAERGWRAAGRFDLVVSGATKVTGGNDDWEPADRAPKGTKTGKASELGHGSIPPSQTSRDGRNRDVAAPGGVAATRITRSASLSFGGLARLRFGSADRDKARAARAVLAAMALLGDRLAFGRPNLFLRSGCDLVLEQESVS
ncbi:MAG TPA: type I-U CRISPR-associated RAMP protein Csb1/Cas7u, partial [Acidimicrobiales bacterium]|nr:type I-U CRISPR-associated RAMP protein Csb1/Cas7u [Acidimicrobiales bacterium]